VGCSAGTTFGDVATVAEVEADVGDGVLAEEDQIPNPCPFTILAAPERCLLVLVFGVTGCSTLRSCITWKTILEHSIPVVESVPPLL
jgi:hypothetical protein